MTFVRVQAPQVPTVSFSTLVDNTVVLLPTLVHLAAMVSLDAREPAR